MRSSYLLRAGSNPAGTIMNKEIINLIGLSVMFSSNQFNLTDQYKLQQYHEGIRAVLEKNHRTSVIGMYVEEAVHMYIANGWETVEVIENGMPPTLINWAEGNKANPKRMRLWTFNDKVTRAIAG